MILYDVTLFSCTVYSYCMCMRVCVKKEEIEMRVYSSTVYSTVRSTR